MKAGFTLVELLVVLAIVAVLAGLLLGATKVVRARGDTARCTANLRQLAGANAAFAADHGGQFVRAQDASNTVRWHGVRASSGEKFDPEKGPLAPYLGRDGGVKICPTFQRALTEEASFNEEGSGGYGYNAVYIGGIPGDAFSSEYLANVAQPSKTVMFTDAAFPNSKGLQEYPFSEPFRAVDYAGRLRAKLSPSVHFRHDERTNVAWCDGHVSSEGPSQLGGINRYGGDGSQWKVGWFGPADENGWWNPRRIGRE